MIDINCDMGEVDELLKNNTYSKLMDHVTSINVACGGHAGDMNMTVSYTHLTLPTSDLVKISVVAVS